MTQPLIVGAGHNGLVAALYLARAGHKPIVLERRSAVGGCAVTGEIARGYRCPSLAHDVGWLRGSIVRDMQLTRRLEFVRAEPSAVALDPNGGALSFYSEPARTADAIRKRSDAAASHYTAFCETFAKLGRFLAPLLETTPPSLDGAAPRELWDLLKVGRRFRALGRTDGHRLLRWMPMAVADLVSEYFSDDLLQGAGAGRANFGATAGPWSAGTGALLLLAGAHDSAPVGRSVTVKGGPGALTKAMTDAAREAGAEIRLGADVTRIVVKDGRAAGVLLSDGSELRAETIVSNADPKRTLLDLVDPMELGPGFLSRIRNYRSVGSLAKVNLALGGLPTFPGVSGTDLRGRILIAPSVDYLEKAFDHSKYGEVSPKPFIEFTIPSLADPSLAPPGHHVLSAYVQFAPYKLAPGKDWSTERETLADIVVRTLEQYAPGLSSTIEHRQIITPLDLEREYALSGGQIFHGEPALDQLFSMRPVLGWAQYRTPIRGLYLCGAGTHPGGGITGGSGQNAAREILKDLR
jgi:phytoene dehydrogenase-like protein